MQGARAPWWVFAVAAGVLGYFVLNVYAELLGPGAIGVDLRYRDGRAVVVPDFPAARAGIGPGDVTASSNRTLRAQRPAAAYRSRTCCRYCCRAPGLTPGPPTFSLLLGG